MSNPVRTTPQNVIDVLGNDWNPDYGASNPSGVPGTPSLVPYINAASQLVDNMVTLSAAPIQGYTWLNTVPYGGSLNSPNLTTIETWLAAHFFMAMQGDYLERRGEGASANFSDKNGGLAINATLYGQMALSLDPSGTLYILASVPPKKARAYWVGGCRPPRF